MNERDAKKILKEMFKKILEYQKQGIMPDNKFNNDFYSIVQKECDQGDSESENMYNLHSYFIENSIEKSISALESVKKEGITINLLYEEIIKIEYIIFLLNKLFTYLDRFFTNGKSKNTLNQKSFYLYKNNFFMPLKKDISNALTSYFKEIDKIDNEENERKIRKIFQFMNTDRIFNPTIVKKNKEIKWENEESENPPKNINITVDSFDDWFHVHFLPDINSLFESKVKEVKNLPIKEYISSILNFKYQPIILKNYFDNNYYNKILFIFNENFIKGNKDKIEEFFFNLNRNDLKKY